MSLLITELGIASLTRQLRIAWAECHHWRSGNQAQPKLNDSSDKTTYAKYSISWMSLLITELGIASLTRQLRIAWAECHHWRSGNQAQPKLNVSSDKTTYAKYSISWMSLLITELGIASLTRQLRIAWAECHQWRSGNKHSLNWMSALTRQPSTA